MQVTFSWIIIIVQTVISDNVLRFDLLWNTEHRYDCQITKSVFRQHLGTVSDAICDLTLSNSLAIVNVSV